MKEIHFYTNLCNLDQVSDWDLDNMLTDHCSTKKAIDDKNERIVKTTQLHFLRNAWDYIENGFKVFIHNGSDILEVKEHMDGTKKDIKKGHNILNILTGGTFGEIK